ncbi:hypothetical protein D9M70_542310 [compost metagenome]
MVWNVIPGWNRTIRTTSTEIRHGIEELKELLCLLPRAQTVVLVGGKAQRALPLIQAMNLRVFTSAHPGPKVRSINPHLWKAIPEQWKQAGLV